MPVIRRLMPYVAAAIVSPRVRAARSSARDLLRRAAGRSHVIRFHYCAWDPLSHLTAQALAPLLRCSGVQVMVQCIHDLPGEILPRREELIRASLGDAPFVAERFGVAFPTGAELPTESRREQASVLAAKWESESQPWEQLVAIGQRLWNGDTLDVVEGSERPALARRLRDNEAEFLRRAGHRPGSLLCAGQWYAGIDRLPYLMTELARAGVRDVPILAIQSESTAAPTGPVVEGPPLELFFSVRSPYSYLAFDRTVEMAERHGRPLLLRPVLPMVMRGLPVPRGKAIALLTDAAREAEERGIAFGRVCDPVGAGVERCYAVARCARELGREPAYFSSCMRACWAEGIDLASDRGLAFASERAGVPWSQAASFASREQWREEVNRNIEALEEAGLWGVPSFRCGDRTTWGQDRLSVVDAWLRDQRATVNPTLG